MDRWDDVVEEFLMPAIGIGPNDQNGHRPIFEFLPMNEQVICTMACCMSVVRFGPWPSVVYLDTCWKCSAEDVPDDEDHIGLCEYCLDELRGGDDGAVVFADSLEGGV